MATKILLAFLVSFLLCGSLCSAQSQRQRFSKQAQQCRLDQLRSRSPARRVESEGGTIEAWDESDAEFQCAGVTAVRVTIKSNSLSLPKFHSSPVMVFIEQGRGYMGANYPGCAETYEALSGESSRRSSSRRMGQRIRGESDEDQHQRVHRIKQGDMITLPAGTVHWTYNDESEDLVAIAFFDLNNNDNQLDLQIRSFYLAGGASRIEKRRSGDEERRSDKIENIFSGLDQEMVAEAFNIPMETARKMQEQTNDLIVKCDEKMTFLTPDEQEEELSQSGSYQGRRQSRDSSSNGLEETVCTSRIIHNMNTQKEADVYSREAGRINILNQHKLPLLRFLGMSAEKGHLFPNAEYNLEWSTTDHRVVYVVAGEADVQIVDDMGNRVFKEKVERGNIFVIPQFYLTTTKAGGNGFEWITFKTSSQPMKSPMVGYTSVLRGFPVQLMEHIFQISTRESEQLKQTRSQHTFLLPPTRRSS